MAERLFVALEELAAHHPNAMATGPFGSSIGTKTFREVGVPVIRGSNLSSDIGKKLIDENLVFIDPDLAKSFHRSQVFEGDLVFTCWGTINQIGIIDKTARYKSYVVSNKQMKFTANTGKVSPLFLYYWFSGPDGQAQILSGGIGSSVPGFNLGQLRKMRVPLPPLPTQMAIISILGALDDKIDLNRRMNETLETMARAIFKDWFVDFGPTRAKMEGRAPYLSPDVWALFPDRLDDEGKPVGWEVVALDKVIDLNPAERLSQGTVAPYLDMAAIPVRGSWPDHPLQRAAGSGARFRNGDTLFARITPCLENGKTAFISRLNENEIGWGSTEFIVIRPRRPVPPEFGYLLAREDTFRAHAILSMTGTSGRQRVQPDSLRTFPIIRATDQVFDAFGTLVGEYFEMVAANEHQSETLAATRDLLLPKLMSGEIRIEDAETMVETVL